MPVNSTHPQYDSHFSQWQRCRDAVDGSDAIKSRGDQYLPKLSEQDSDEYKAYQKRALWYGASARTIQGLTGAVMRKEPAVEAATALDEHLKDVTLTGISFQAFAKTTLEEVLKTGRYGVLVDMPAVTHDTQRPYYAAYTGESIVNWRTVIVNGIPKLVLVVLCEQLWDPKPDDAYTMECIEQYRVLRLHDNRYEVETYRQSKETDQDWVSQGLVLPMFRGARLDYIPFCFFGPNTITPDIEKPPILDLVEVNLSHFRTSADLEHGAHFCGLPTPWVAGFPENKVLKIGSSVAWVSNDKDAKAGMLEFTGQGLGALETRLKEKQSQMAVLGARLLEEAKPAVEAADTLSMRFSGEQSVLRSVAGSVSTGLSKLLEWAGLWSGVSPEEAKKAVATLNTDFMDAQMTFAELTQLVSAWQSGAISYETMYYNMQRGEVTRPGIEAEEERQLIDIQKGAPDEGTDPNADPNAPLPEDQQKEAA